MAQEEAVGHLAICYGVICGEREIDLASALLNFLYAQVSATINNAVKLVPLSQTAGQQILLNLYPLMESALTQVLQLQFSDLGMSAPGFELRAMQHEILYSRLYMS